MFDIVAIDVQETRTIYPRPNWAEQNQDEWFLALKQCVKRVLHKARASPEDVKGIGISAQAHGLSLVDDKCRPLHNCLIWPDLRATKQAERIMNSIIKSGKKEILKRPISAHYTAAKLVWMMENHPDLVEKAYKFLVPKDYLRTKLTLDFCTDPTDAWATDMYDMESKDWNWELIDFMGIPRRIFPKVIPTESIAGYVTRDAAAEIEVPEGTLVVTGGADWSSTVILLSKLNLGKCLIIYLGTAPIIVALGSKGEKLAQGAMSANGGALLKWIKEQIIPSVNNVSERTGVSPYALIDQMASQIEPGSEGLVFLPHMMGERTPYNDYARGVIFGLCLGHRVEHIIRAAIEGITFQLKYMVEYFRDKYGGVDEDIDKVVVIGGGSKSDLWMQIIADIFKVTAFKINYEEVTVLNAARLVAAATGLLKDESLLTRKVSLGKAYYPIESNTRKYEKAYELFKKVSKSLQPLFIPEIIA